jgi:TolA-binding protein
MSGPDWINVEAHVARRIAALQVELSEARASATETLEQRVCRLQGRIESMRELQRLPETLAPTSD